MFGEKTRVQKIWEALNSYKIDFRPSCIYLLEEDSGLDIMNLQEKSYFDKQEKTIFNEDDLHRFSLKIEECLRNKDISPLINGYFKKSSLSFKYEQTGTMHVITWNLNSGALGESFFEKPGAIIAKDVNDYWIIVFYSENDLKIKDYTNESSGLEELITELED